MPVDILVGTQWGDEGKGKLIDVLTRDCDMVVRFQGGNNAGHTVEIGDKKFVLHLVPSGIFRPGVACLIGNGVVVDPVALTVEMRNLEKSGLDVSTVELSDKAQLIFDYHRNIDSAKEAADGGNKKIGTTKRGIGPAYSDKAERCGIRGWMLKDPVKLKEAFYEQAEKYNVIFARKGVELINIDESWTKVADAAAYLEKHVADTVISVNNAIKAGKKILCEGAQGMLLDVDHGTYPFVTSSNTISGGACTGAGIAPTHIRDIWGVLKAYTTRVGEGPFPTELFAEDGDTLRRIGNEFGATTGRPRRCGWFDAVASSYSCMVNGINKLAITKMDVLDQLAEIKICVAYEIDGVKIESLPSSADELARVKPVYETVPGWMADTTKCQDYNDLPENAKKYLAYIAKLVNSQIAIISVGPKREQTFSA
ncbi:MAG: adenylosuccinate synthase [Victivallaceae bacterium]|nr:adenylosuccinate synthase [Victivallaceae bacterium]